MSGLRGAGPKFAEQAIPPTSAPAPKLEESLALARLSRMLRNTLQSWPKAKLLKRAGGFGVSLDAETYLYVSCSGNLTAGEKRDLLVLFAAWQITDGEGLQKAPGPPGG